MQMRIEPSHISIGRLFSENNIFRVPKYQRNYAWTDEQITDFVEDLKKCSAARTVDKARAHFFGGIVSVGISIPGSSTNQYELVDGQQRMATFTLFVAAMVSLYKSLRSEAIAVSDTDNTELIEMRLEELTKNYLTKRVEVNRQITPVDRLEISEADKQYFKNVINEHPCTETRESHRRLDYAYKTIKSFISDDVVAPLPTLSDKLDAMKRFEEILNDDFTVIHMVTGSEKEAYRLFQVLNDRGTGLTVGDLLRSRTMQLLEEQTYLTQQNRIQQAWDDILSDPPKVTEDFLRWYYASEKGKRPSKASLLDDFLDAFFPQHDNYDELVQSSTEADAIVNAIGKIQEEVAVYRKLLEGRWPYAHQQPITQWDRNRLRLLLVELQHTHCMPILLAAKKKLTHREFSNIVQLIEKFIFRYRIISNQHISRVTKIYLEEAVTIRNSSESSPYRVSSLKSKLRRLLHSRAPDSVFSSHLHELEYKQRGSNKPLKYFLITLEHYARWYRDGANDEPQCREKTRTFDFANTTIEHIYPQNPNTRDSTLEPLVNNLGNLTFLGPQDNQDAGNEDFLVKRSIFEQSSVSLNNDIAQEVTWDRSAIDRHREKLIDMALKIFVV